MADYTTITDAQVDPEAPITSELMSALRDNPLAIAEGATGAPRLVGEAAATVDEYPVLTVSAADTYGLGLAVDFTNGITNTTSTSYVVAGTADIVRVNGSARFKGSHRSNTAGISSQLRVLKNGTELANWTTASTTPVERSIDISIVIGDQITWEHRRIGGTGSSIGGSAGYFATDGITTTNLLIKETTLAGA